MTDHAVEDLKLHRLRPLRVLLAGRDRRYLRVTSFLLSQRGYDVVETSSKKTLQAVERHKSDVILLETNDTRGVAARMVAALETLPTAPSVLVVFEDNEDDRWQGFKAVKKWTPIDELVQEIETAAVNRPAPLLEVERAYR
jgi:CheY-like chemotaxis protein